MALDKLTKIDGGGLSTTSNYRVGIITATKFIGPIEGTITSTDATFTGSVSIGGTLTYEDVTNIDSIGIITARNGLVVSGTATVNDGLIFDNGTNAGKDLQWQPSNNRLAFFNDVKATFGNTVDLQIYHTSSEGHIYGSTNKPIIFSTNTNERLRITSAGQVQINTDGGSGALTLGASQDFKLYHDAGGPTIFSDTANQGFKLQIKELNLTEYTGSTTRLKIDSSGRTMLGTTTEGYSSADDLTVATSGHTGITIRSGNTSLGTLAFSDGTSGSAEYDGYIQYSQNDRYMDFATDGGNVRLRIDSDGRLLIGTTDAGHSSADDLTINNSGNGGITIRTGTTSNGAIFFADSTSGDARFDGFVQYNHGTNPYMIFGTNTDEKLRIDKNGKVTVKSHAHDGGLELLSSNNSQSTRLRLQAKSSGGTSYDWYLESARGTDRFTIHDGTTSWFTILGDGKVGINETSPTYPTEIKDSRTDAYSASTTNADQHQLRINNAGLGGVAGILLTAEPSSGSAGHAGIRVISPSSGNAVMTFSVRDSGTYSEKLRIDSSGHLLPGANASYDIGENSSSRWRNIYGGTLSLTSYATVASIVATDPGSSYYAYNNRIGNGLAVVGTTRLFGSVGINSTAPTAKLEIADAAQTNLLTLKRTSGNSGIFSVQLGGSDPGVLLTTTGISDDFVFRPGGNDRLRIKSDGSVLPAASGTQNLGSTTLEWGHVYLADDKKVQLGSSQDFQIYHQSSDNNSYIVEGGTGSLMIQGDIINIGNVGSSKYYIRCFEDGAVQLRYGNNLTKLATTATGIEVTGEVAASQDYPNFRPTLDFNFAAEKKLDSRITYQRTGVASFVNEFGKIIIVGDNTPRFDHDADTGECKGLLMEETRTNLQPHSEQYSPEASDGFINIVTNMTVDYDPGVVTPTGETTGAVTFVESGGSGQHYLGLDHYGAVTSGQTYTFSFFIKNISGSDTDNVKVITTTAAFPYVVRTFYFSGTNAGTTNNADSFMTKLPNGWWRCSITVTTNNNFSQTAFSIDYRGYGSGSPYNNKVALWGIQAELGAFPTSYIRTGNDYSGATQTRGVDITTIEDQEFTEFYNDDEWTMITDTTVDNTQSLVASPAGVNSINFEGDNNTKKFSTRYVTSSTVNQGYVDVIGAMSGTSYYDLTGGGVGNYNMKTAHAAKYNDVAASHNGGTVQTDTSVTMLTGGSIMNIGQNPKQFHIKRIMYYPKRLPNSQLVTLTS